MSTLTKKMAALIKGMGNEKHMIFFVGFFDYFDQMLSHTSNQEGQI